MDKTTILQTAANIVDGDREQTYGTPDKNLRTIAAFWTTLLHSRGTLPGHTSITVDDVCMMMMLLKVARLAHDPHHKDSLVDVCGYARLMERCQEQPKASNTAQELTMRAYNLRHPHATQS